MKQPSDYITKFLIVFVIAVFFIKTLGGSGIFVSGTHKGKGYKVRIPEGWTKMKKDKNAVHPRGVDIVTFVLKSDSVDDQMPEMFISIYNKKLTTPIWIEDEFPSILKSLSDAGFNVMDKGEIKLDEVVSHWVVYHDVTTQSLNLEFYLVTDNSMYYKMLYSAHPDQFNVYRSDFEEFKNSFRFRFSII